MKTVVDNALKADLLDKISEPIIFFNPEKKAQWANRAYLKAVGLPLDKLSEVSFYRVFGASEPGGICPVSRALETGQSATAELTSITLSVDDADKIYLVKAEPVKNDEEKTIGVVASMLDITDRKEAEAALQKSEARLKEAQRLAHIGSWELDLQKNSLFWSDEIYRIFEINPEYFNATYEAFLDVIHPDDRTLVDDTFKESLEKKRPYEVEHRLQLSNGRIKFVHECGKTFFDDRGEPIRSIGTVWDITDQKTKEEENQKLQERYHRAQRMETVGRLAGGVAHDFNNMLSVILGRADLIMDQLDPGGPVYSSLKEIQHAAERSADLIRQLLAFARRQTTDPVFLNLNEVIGNMTKMLHRLIGEDIDLEWIPGKDLGTVKMDPSQLEQVMANLCVNARDAIDGVGKITIETHNAFFDEAYCAANPGFIPGNYILLAVSDNGCGMTKEIQHQIFEPFFTTKQNGKGTGLGLATVFGIVKQNNGFINVYSEPEKGTTFKIYLSRHKMEAESFRIKDKGPLPMGNGELILLVEDEEMVLEITQTILENLNYRVVPTSSPSEAVEYVKNKGDDATVDLLLTDVVMPEMNGAELAKTIETIIPDIKTLFMSAYTTNVVSRHGVLKKGVAFLQKPASKQALAFKIHEMILSTDKK